MAGEALYFDSSALVKLVVEEAESLPLLRLFEAASLRFASDPVKVEVPRAVRKSGEGAKRLKLWDRVQEDLSFVAIDDSILNLAAGLAPATLRSLDAIHLASALVLGKSLEAFIAYDNRLANAARAVPLQLISPGADAAQA